MSTKARGDAARRTDDQWRNQHPGAGEQTGEALGGVGGTLAGAAIGAAGGPIGMILGGLAGAFGGWWAGEKAGRAAEDAERHHDVYHGHWERLAYPDLDWDTARVGYGVGHAAGMNPGYANLPFEEIESDLRRGWTWKDQDYETMRPYVRHAYEHSARTASTHEPKPSR